MFEKLPSAAVLVLLCEEGGRTEVLVTRRSKKLKSHPGEICCPGGKRDPSDQSPADCALRETWEEVGISGVKVIGQLAPIKSRGGLAVFPVVGTINCRPQLILNPDEVERAFWIPLEAFLQAERHVEFEWEWQGQIYPIHEVRWRTTLVNGITCAIIIETARWLWKRDPPFPFSYPVMHMEPINEEIEPNVELVSSEIGQ